MNLPPVALKLDVRLLAGHQRVADIVHFLTGHPCYDLARASNLVALTGWLILLLLYVPLGVLVGRGAGPFANTVLCVAALVMAVGMLRLARRTDGRLRMMHRAWLSSWICRGLPMVPRPGVTAETPEARLLNLGIAVCMALTCGVAMSNAQFDAVTILGLTGTILMGAGVPATAYFEACRPRPPGRSRPKVARPEGVTTRA